MKKLIACTLMGTMMLTSSAYATTMEMENHTGEVLERVIENDLSELKKSYNKADKYHLPTGSDNVIRIGMDKIDCTITLPADVSDSNNQRRNSDERAVYQDDTKTFTNQVAVTDLGLEVLTVLNSEEAPKAYDFETGTDGSVRLEKATGSQDVILVYNNDGLVVAVIENMLAKDANGKAVKTVFDIRNNVITQRIDTQDSSITYPITSGINVYSTGSAADLLDWFNDAHWIWRADGVSLRLYAKDWCKSANVTTALKEATWAAVYNYFRTEGHWSNTEGMRKQYLCHVDYAKYEADWNLEPWRPNVSYSQTVVARCNPV